MDKVDVRFPQEKPKGAPANLPTTAEERATALIGLMERLSAHLDRETAAIRQRRPAAEMAQLAKDKQPMVLVYEEVSRLLRIDPDGMAKLPDPVKERLKDVTRALYLSAGANAAALRLREDAQQMVVDTVVAAVNRARQSQPGVAYGPTPTPYGGTPPRGYGPPRHGPATAATLNTKL
ncbi:flagellar basal-body protein [Azospirillum sp.]|uniref:flagellar basal-body protein n=1 Tax=Azospirillum sp. TaxID=34012 RepID=UPI002D523742|nr:flagellar basal-body protein [Azospirillum sp.]HYD70020.1 flagellar basal-body protein [Azospirillum sp.]